MAWHCRDEPTVRMLLNEILTESGYPVLEAVDAPSAVKVVDANPNIALMITDVGLPGGMNGRQLAEAVRERSPRLKIFSAFFQTGMIARLCVLGTSFLSVVCAGTLKFGLLWADTVQKVFTPTIAITILVLVYSFLTPQFSVSIFGYVIYGAIWEIIGVVVGFVFVTQDMTP